MKIKATPITKLTPYEGNPRKISIEAIEKVAESIKAFGFRQPIVADPNGVIIAGHTRLAAAKHLGLDKVPVVTAELTDEYAKAYRIADNRTAEFTGWQIESLAEELTRLEGQHIPGFTSGEIEAILESIDDAEDYLPGTEDDAEDDEIMLTFHVPHSHYDEVRSKALQLVETIQNE